MGVLSIFKNWVYIILTYVSIFKFKSQKYGRLKWRPPQYETQIQQKTWRLDSIWNNLIVLVSYGSWTDHFPNSQSTVENNSHKATLIYRLT